MGLGDWIRRVFGRPAPLHETVPYYDFEVGRVVRIPVSELRPGVVQARVQGIEEVVWVLPEQLKPSEVCHPPFDEEVRQLVEEIRHAFAEHRPLSLEEWEDGFRRDLNPEQEIAMWSHAADVYKTFAAEELSAERRSDIYRTIVACLTTAPDSVWHVLRTAFLSRPEAQQIVNRFYGGSSSTS